MKSTLLGMPYCPFSPRAVKSFGGSALHCLSHDQGRKIHLSFAALPENSASIVLVAMAVGAAATLLVRRTTQSNEISVTCEDCGGSGICSECNGEGFVLRQLSEDTSSTMAEKSTATQYTIRLPRKWSYCSKCSSSRSCRACDGTGKFYEDNERIFDMGCYEEYEENEDDVMKGIANYWPMPASIAMIRSLW
ncbi:hypothetical protein HPP92_007165 [Vanilla planifolia]|uniref:DUF7895 domain-containing protein n=1 Tax=Vanilla planifolia TaxID=51239 RepID=A0A835RG46_VANPL|nr:hypothetical protein HPP92_007165 [Vanilla planifolia]